MNSSGFPTAVVRLGFPQKLRRPDLQHAIPKRVLRRDPCSAPERGSHVTSWCGADVISSRSYSVGILDVGGAGNFCAFFCEVFEDSRYRRRSCLVSEENHFLRFTAIEFNAAGGGTLHGCNENDFGTDRGVFCPGGRGAALSVFFVHDEVNCQAYLVVYSGWRDLTE